MVPGQFGADNSSRTIRRKVYVINFIENPASTQQYSFHQSQFHFSNLSSILLPFRQYFFHQLLTLTHIVWIEIGLLIEYRTLYTLIHYNQIIKGIFDDK